MLLLSSMLKLTQKILILNILIDKKSYKNILIYDISYKNSFDSKPLQIRFNKIDNRCKLDSIKQTIDGIVRTYDGTRYLFIQHCLALKI